MSEVSSTNLNDSNGELQDVFYLPPPLPREEAFPRNRVPSPIAQTNEELDLDYVSTIWIYI